VIFDERSFGGRTPSRSLHPLSTLLNDELDNSVSSDTPAVSNSETNESQGQTCNMCTCSGNGTQERAGQDLLCLVDLYLVYLI